MTKVCNKCKIEKSLDLFSKRKEAKDGCRYQCKACASDSQKVYRLNDLEKYKQKAKIFREKHKERDKTYKKKYWQENKSKLKIIRTKWRENNLDKIEKKARIYREKNKGKIASYHKSRRANFRKQVLDYYSNGTFACNCCGENNEQFLCVDHIFNDGNEHRKTVKASNLNKWLVTNNFPEGFQILCYNCNFGKAQNKGTCPHNNQYLKLVKGANK